jgi:hypothetical protein
LIPGCRIDRKGPVRRTEAFRIRALEVQGRPPQPATHELEQLLAHRAEVRAMHRAQLRGLRQFLHEIVEPVGKLLHGGFTADLVVRSGSSRFC